jgi:hypothetical protein
MPNCAKERRRPRGLLDELRTEQAVRRSQRMRSLPAQARVRKFCPHSEEAADRHRQPPMSMGSHLEGWTVGRSLNYAETGEGRPSPKRNGGDLWPFFETRAQACVPEVHAAADCGPAARRQRQHPHLVSHARKRAIEYPPRLRFGCRISSFDRVGVTGCPAFAANDTATGMKSKSQSARSTRPFPSHHLTKPTIHEIIWRERT